MKVNTTPTTRTWAPASSSLTSRFAGLWLAVLPSLTLFAPAASAAVSLTADTEVPDDCVVMSGAWSTGSGPWDSDVDIIYNESVGLEIDLLVDSSMPLFPGVFEETGVLVLLDLSEHPAGEALWVTFDHDSSDVHSAFLSFDEDFNLVVTPAEMSGVFPSSGRGYLVTAEYDPQKLSWSGTYKVTEADCTPSHGVPDTGSALAFFACGLGAVGGMRRVMAKRQRA